MGELAEEERVLSGLPEWVPLYLAAWGSVRPDGKKMSVTWAAGLAGISVETVRGLRMRSRQFRIIEYVARHGSAAFMASYAEAGVRGAAPQILTSFLKLIADGEYHTVIQAMKWLMDKPDVQVEGDVGVFNLQEWMEKRGTRLGEVEGLEDGAAAAGGSET